MAIKTKKELVDEILYEVYAGTPPDNASISANFILRGVNSLIAESVMKSAFQTNSMEGVTYADDIFFVDYKNLTLLNDEAKGIRYVPLPALPIGLPRSRSYRVYPATGGALRNSTLFKPIEARDVSKILNLPSTEKIYHFVEGGRMYFISCNKWAGEFNVVNMVIATSGANDLSEPLNLPDDMLKAIKNQLVLDCRKMMGLSDNLPNTNQTPQPR